MPQKAVSVQNILISRMPARMVITRVQDMTAAPDNSTGYPFATPPGHGSI
jgi:hypothetical protein